MNRLICMTGPHRHPLHGGWTRAEWRVFLAELPELPAEGPGNEPQHTGKRYRVRSYRRAVALACRMAEDRRLPLRMDALPS